MFWRGSIRGQNRKIGPSMTLSVAHTDAAGDLPAHATKLLDHLDGWEKVYTDDIATIHLRKAGARHTAEPVVAPKPR
jgi:hypothetical protein